MLGSPAFIYSESGKKKAFELESEPTKKQKALQRKNIKFQRGRQHLLNKIQDINKLIQIIEQVKQLKCFRQQQNVDTTEIMNDHNNCDYELIEIHKLCTEKLLEYKTEMNENFLIPRIDLFNYLFNNNNQSFYESNDPNSQYLLRAHQSMSNLVQIRQAWDQYLNTNITSANSSIPLKWYEPNVPYDSNWAQFIFHKDESKL